MRRIQYFVACSLDGFIATDNDDISWLFTDNDYGYKEFFDSIDTTLTGRKTFDIIRGFDEFPYSGKKNYVFSRQLMNVSDPEVEYISNDIVPFIRRLKEEAGKNIWLVGGASLASVLENASLIDDYIISIHPVLLGSGKPLFSESSGIRHLQLHECSNFPSGLVQLRYSRIQINSDQVNIG